VLPWLAAIQIQLPASRYGIWARLRNPLLGEFGDAFGVEHSRRLRVPERTVSEAWSFQVGRCRYTAFAVRGAEVSADEARLKTGLFVVRTW
jgi:hypothetical protein